MALKSQPVTLRDSTWRRTGLDLYLTTIGAVHRNVPHSITSVPRRASAGTMEMVNSSTGAAGVSSIL